MHPNVVGALVNSALYLLCVFVAGIVMGHPWAWKLALVAMGVTYLSHMASLQAVVRNNGDLLTAANAVVAGSVVLGALAGFALLF